jgi:hypothetical protein
MLEIGGELDFLEKTLGSEDRREICVQDLYRNFAMVFEILGEIDRRHATGAKLALDTVAVGKRSG